MTFAHTRLSPSPEGVTSVTPNARFKQDHPLSPHTTTCPALVIPISRAGRQCFLVSFGWRNVTK